MSHLTLNFSQIITLTVTPYRPSETFYPITFPLEKIFMNLAELLMKLEKFLSEIIKT